MKIILHVGMPKCGSSAIQNHLSSAGFQHSVGDRYGYAAVHQDGRAIHGDELVVNAARSPFRYEASHPAAALNGMPDKRKRNAAAEVRELAAKCQTVILSCEDWGPRLNELADNIFFAELDLPVTVVAYVRPQTAWFNSAWWQWGAWCDSRFEQWLRANYWLADWNEALTKWEAIPWVSKVDVRLMKGDVCEDFLRYLGEPSAEGLPPMNPSLPGAVLRLFQRNRQLRPGPHDSRIEFALGRHLQFESGRTPWVIAPEFVEEIIERYRPGNEKLLERLDPQLQPTMRDDPAWWSPEAFDGRVAESPDPIELDPQELEKVAVAALNAVHRLDIDLIRGR